MSTFVYMTRCDGCGHCVDICPSDIMHIDENIRRAVNIEPNFCWECYSCVKACPNHAIDVRGYADFAPMGHSVRVRRVLFRSGLGYLFLVLFITSNIVLFGGVYWSKFAHMIYKPGAAIQKNLAEADGSRDNLPPLADAPKQFGLGIKREQPKHY